MKVDTKEVKIEREETRTDEEQTEVNEEEIDNLDPRDLELESGEGGHIKLKILDRGEKYERVRPESAFPLSGVMECVRFVQGEDGDKEELGMLNSPQDLEQKSYQVLKTTLEKIYFMPEVTAVKSIEEGFGISGHRWNVDTKKGERSFEVESRRRDVKRLPNNRIIVEDKDGNRYEIPDHTQLDQRSQKILHTEI